MRARARIVASSFLATGLVLVPATARADGGHGDGGGDPPTLSAPLAAGLAGPLQIAIGERKEVYVAQGFSGQLTTIGRKGAITSIPVPAVDGVDERDGKVLIARRSIRASSTATRSAS